MAKKPIEVLLTNPWRKRMAGSLSEDIKRIRPMVSNTYNATNCS